MTRLFLLFLIQASAIERAEHKGFVDDLKKKGAALVEDAQDQAGEKIEALKNAAQGKFMELQEQGQQAVMENQAKLSDMAMDKVDEVRSTVEERISDMKNQAETQVAELQEQAQKQLEEYKEQAYKEALQKSEEAHRFIDPEGTAALLFNPIRNFYEILLGPREPRNFVVAGTHAFAVWAASMFVFPYIVVILLGLMNIQLFTLHLLVGVGIVFCRTGSAMMVNLMAKSHGEIRTAYRSRALQLQDPTKSFEENFAAAMDQVEQRGLIGSSMDLLQDLYHVGVKNVFYNLGKFEWRKASHVGATFVKIVAKDTQSHLRGLATTLEPLTANFTKATWGRILSLEDIKAVRVQLQATQPGLFEHNLIKHMNAGFQLLNLQQMKTPELVQLAK